MLVAWVSSVVDTWSRNFDRTWDTSKIAEKATVVLVLGPEDPFVSRSVGSGYEY